MLLQNRISQNELKKRLMEEPFHRITISFYQYSFISDPVAFRDKFYQKLNEMKVFGRIYVASEGVNAQLSVPEFELENFKSYIQSIAHLKDALLDYAVDDDGKSFWVLKVKVRKKIVADGIADPTFSMQNKGQYVNADEFNKLTDNPDTIVVDMRNHYEYEVGHFKNAIEVPSETFREQLPMAADMLKEDKEKNVIMYCTGGIRCEKASAYLKHRGFKHVYHLRGGIINYAHMIKDEELANKFLGKNFVFDKRLGEKIGNEVISHCHQCGKLCDRHVNCANNACHLLFIQCEECAAKYDECCSEQCQEVIHLPIEKQKELRKGVHNGRKIFNNKSRVRMDALRHY